MSWFPPLGKSKTKKGNIPGLIIIRLGLINLKCAFVIVCSVLRCHCIFTRQIKHRRHSLFLPCQPSVCRLSYCETHTRWALSCSRAVSGKPPTAFDANSWRSVSFSHCRISSISPWKPWACNTTQPESGQKVSHRLAVSHLWLRQEDVWVINSLDSFGYRVFVCSMN